MRNPEVERHEAIASVLHAFRTLDIVATPLTVAWPAEPRAIKASLTDITASVFVCARTAVVYLATPVQDIGLRRFGHYQLCCTDGHGRHFSRGQMYTPVSDDDHLFIETLSVTDVIDLDEHRRARQENPDPEPA